MKNVALLTLLVTGACAVHLVSDYDDTTDREVSQLQRSVDSFLLSLARNPKAPEAARALVLERVPRDEDFLDEGAIQPEDLKPIVRAIGDVDQVVVGHQDRVHRIVEPLRGRPLNQLCATSLLPARWNLSG